MKRFKLFFGVMIALLVVTYGSGQSNPATSREYYISIKTVKPNNGNEVCSMYTYLGRKRVFVGHVWVEILMVDPNGNNGAGSRLERKTYGLGIAGSPNNIQFSCEDVTAEVGDEDYKIESPGVKWAYRGVETYRDIMEVRWQITEAAYRKALVIGADTDGFTGFYNLYNLSHYTPARIESIFRCRRIPTDQIAEITQLVTWQGENCAGYAIEFVNRILDFMADLNRINYEKPNFLNKTSPDWAVWNYSSMETYINSPQAVSDLPNYDYFKKGLDNLNLLRDNNLPLKFASPIAIFNMMTTYANSGKCSRIPDSDSVYQPGDHEAFLVNTLIP